MKTGTLVTQVTEVAAVNPSAKAIVVSLDDPEVARAAQEAFGMMQSEGKVPPVFIFPSEVGLADKKGKGPNLGVYLGMNELAKLLSLEGEQIKTALAKLIAEP